MLTTPETIRTLQRKLYTEAKQETVFRYALNGRVRRRDILSRANKRRMGKCACLGVKNIGKPCAGQLHARFDEGGQARACPLLYPSVKKRVALPGRGKSGGARVLVASPMKFSGTPIKHEVPPPVLGQHTDEILSSVLKKSEAEIAKLKTGGIV